MEDLIGRKIENYQILSVLGKGGMGVVYKAHDDKLDRFVAIKVLSVKAVDKERFIERFKREAKNHAQLLHPNIVTVYGFIEYDSLLGIVMEYVDGESLERVLFKNNRLHIFDVVYIIRQVLEAIGYAHSKGFVHRDIKPSNILLNHEGTVKIMDFGISKSLIDKGLTKTGSKVGTVYYMSPEQIRGDEIDKQTDIYAIGCTIFEMVTGKPPFFSEQEYDIMDGHLKKDAPRLASIIQGTPVVLDEIVSKSLKKMPAERYQHCEDILQKLHELDDYMKNVHSRYFLRTNKNPKKTKFFSIAAFTSFIVIMSALTYFVYVQVGELLRSNVLQKLKDGNFEVLFSPAAEVSDINFPITKIEVPFANINAVSAKGDTALYAVGDSAEVFVIHPLKGDYSKLIIPSRESIRDIFILQDSGILMVGDNSSLIRSNDSFSSSTNLSMSGNFNFYNIEFFYTNLGFIVGSQGVILKSTDYGATWSRSISSTANTLFDLDMITPKDGYAVGWAGTLIKTDDGGSTWTIVENFTDKYLRALDFVNESTGLICGGAGVIFKTNDGGKYWRLIDLNINTGLSDIKFIDLNKVIAVGAKGLILYSKDQGESWSKVENTNYANLNRITVSDNGNIYLCGVGGTILTLNIENKE